MGNTLLQDNPTMKDIKIFLKSIEENIQNYSINIDNNNETLEFISNTTTIINTPNYNG